MKPMPKKKPFNLKRASALVCLALAAPMLQAGVVNSGSDESDGMLVFTQTGTIEFDPATSAGRVLDPDGDGEYHFTSVHIGPDTVVEMRADKMGNKPVIWRVSGNVTIEGTLDLDGELGHSSTDIHLPSVPGPGGFQGGAGSTSTKTAEIGSGPGGGRIDGDSYNSGAGGSHANTGQYNETDKIYGNAYLIPLVGGSGGAGGNLTSYGAGGGAGGGAIMIVSDTRITVEGTVSAVGGGGGASTYYKDNCSYNTCNYTYGRGGSGTGGTIRLIAPTIVGSGVLNVSGGAGARRATDSSGSGDYRGPSGSSGRVRVEAFDNQFTGTVTNTGSATFSTPGLVFSPSAAPKLEVVSVAGQALPDSPKALFDPADLELSEDGEVDIILKGYNIPLGATVKLRLANEVGGVQNLSASLYSGSLAESTATIRTTLPHGFSRFSVEANWTAPATRSAEGS